MLYILYIISALFLLITIFFIKVNYLIYIAIAFFILHIIFTKSIFMTIKKLLYLIPYFLAIFIIQALNSRGEYYNLFGFYIDKVGADFTIIYFIRIASILYFLSIFFIIINVCTIWCDNIFTCPFGRFDYRMDRRMVCINDNLNEDIHLMAYRQLWNSNGGTADSSVRSIVSLYGGWYLRQWDWCQRSHSCYYFFRCVHSTAGGFLHKEFLHFSHRVPGACGILYFSVGV